MAALIVPPIAMLSVHGFRAVEKQRDDGSFVLSVFALTLVGMFAAIWVFVLVPWGEKTTKATRAMSLAGLAVLGAACVVYLYKWWLLFVEIGQ